MLRVDEAFGMDLAEVVVLGLVGCRWISLRLAYSGRSRNNRAAPWNSPFRALASTCEHGWADTRRAVLSRVAVLGAS